MASTARYDTLPLDESKQSDSATDDGLPIISYRRWDTSNTVSLTFLISGIIAWTVAWLTVESIVRTSEDRVFSPVDVVIEDEQWHFGTHPDEAYYGPLNTEQDTAWRTLCGESEGFVQIKMTDEMSKKLPPSTKIPKFPDHQLYGLAVCHQLHCLNILRLAADPDYYESITPTKDHSPGAMAVHTGHCLDYLRQTVMCKGDTALEYFKWSNEMGRTFLQMDIAHQCVNFDKIVEWSDKHQLRDRGKWMGLHYSNESAFD